MIMTVSLLAYLLMKDLIPWGFRWVKVLMVGLICTHVHLSLLVLTIVFFVYYQYQS